MLPCEMLDMSAARVPLISTLSMSRTVVKSSLEDQGPRGRAVSKGRQQREPPWPRPGFALVPEGLPIHTALVARKTGPVLLRMGLSGGGIS